MVAYQSASMNGRPLDIELIDNHVTFHFKKGGIDVPKPIRFAMMGAGFIARPNGAALIAQPEVRLVAISNRTVSKAEKVAADIGADCKIYQDWLEMIENESLDAVLINLPHYMHRDVFITCAKKGLNIIIEKALANTYQECLDMIQAAQENKIRATVCHTQRYHAVFQAAKSFIETHDLGPLRAVSDHIHTHYFWDGRSSWQLSNEQSGGGIALNYGVHQLDRVHFFLNQRTVQFSAKYLTAKEGYVIPSSYTMMGVGEKGTPYTINCTGYTGPHTDELRLVFDQGILHCCVKGSGLYESGLYFGDTKSGQYIAQPVSLAADHNYYRQFAAAVQYIAGQSEIPPVSLEWAAEMVQLVELGFREQ